jgi:membrane protease YdiL (CAAX protease family)
MAQSSSGRRLIILIGLVLTLVLPLLHFSSYAEHIPGVPALVGREASWWTLVAVVLVYILAIERRSLASVGLHRPTWKTLAFGVGGAAVIFAAGIAVNGFLLPALHLHTDPKAGLSILHASYLYRVALVIRAPIVEELLFRGYGIERLEELTGSKFVAGAVSLAAFTAAHLSYWGYVPLIGVATAGLVLTIMYLWRRDLLSNMIAHFITDAVGLLVVG